METEDPGPAGRETARLLGLLRHAKAVADAPGGGSDHERPLAPRGRRDATALGQVLAAGGAAFPNGSLPSVALCSTAARTTETAERALAGVPARIDRRRRLYYGSPTDLLDEMRTVPEGDRSVLVVGHNPAIGELALLLGGEADEGSRAVLVAGGFPTCGLAVYRLPDAPWSAVAPGTGVLTAFLSPPY